ncbi:MAG: TIGR04086 family membrane protein [Oscillospiraceae bacterium]
MSSQHKVKKNVKPSIVNNDLIINSIKGSMAGFLVLIFSFALLAFYNMKAEKALPIKVFSILLCMFSSFICGFIAAIKTKYKAILVGFISSILFLTYLFLTLIIASKLKISASALILLPICSISSIIGSICKKNIKHLK